MRLICLLLIFETFALTQNSVLVHNGKIVTVNSKFQIAQAMVLRGDRILDVGTSAAMSRLAGPKAESIDLKGRTVLPGLMDSHVHAGGASLYEFDHTVPDMETIADVLNYIRGRATSLPPGEWIRVSQVFITRLREQRFPTKEELDKVTPKHPIYFSTGPDASLNSMALRLSGINKAFTITDGKPCRVERTASGEPTGILRSCARFISYTSKARKPTLREKQDSLKRLLADYNSVGITSVADRNAEDEEIEVFRALHESNQLSCRVFLTYAVDAQLSMQAIQDRIQNAAKSPLHAYNNMLWLRGIKLFLDGGMLTGSAFMLKPWGVSSVYSIDDPQYQGMKYIQPDKLYQIAKLALQNDFQITAHSVGDGAVTALVDAYERINEHDFALRGKRPSITHSNFMTPEVILKMKQMGVVADLQPAWLWLDGATLLKQFGNERMKYFQPYKTLFDQGIMVGGGSDHMQKIGSLRSINPYNPFLAMWIAVSRQPRWMEGALHTEQAISRAQAIQLYTINNAFLMFQEKEKGSLEAGKLADFIVLDRDILTCPVAQIKDITVDETYLGGKRIYRRQ